MMSGGRCGVGLIAKFIRNESLGRELRTIQIAERHAIATEPKFAGNTDGREVASKQGDNLPDEQQIVNAVRSATAGAHA